MQPPMSYETLGQHLLHDQATEHDALGFDPYVTAVADFLLHERTSPPITLSVEGDWGSGKSSFIKQLRKKLQGRKVKPLMVSFDASRNDKEEALWASFALEFIRQVSRQRFFLLRPILRGWLRWKRMDVEPGGWWRSPLLALWDVLYLAALVFTTYFALTNILPGPVRAVLGGLAKVAPLRSTDDAALTFTVVGAVVTLTVSVIGVFREIRGAFVNVLESKLQKYVADPKYKEHTTLLNRFHSDFKSLIDVYAGKRRVVVFIEDLDRCEPGTAADLMQAINLMIGDDPGIIFVIAMDRHKIAAGYAVKHEKLMPYLASWPIDDEGAPDQRFSATVALDYGYAFLEKFIQVPFLVPRVNAEALRNMVRQTAPVQPTFSDIVARWTAGARTWVQAIFSSEPETTAPSADGPSLMTPDIEIEMGAGDSDGILEAALLVAPALDFNPRRFKQFLNTFRLRCYLAWATGLLYRSPTAVEAPIKLAQLAKFVALTLRWPQLVALLAEDPTLVSPLLDYAYGQTDRSRLRLELLRWAHDEKLRQLITAGCLRADGKPSPRLVNEYGLDGLSLPRLLRVSPLIRRPRIAAGTAVAIVNATAEAVGEVGSSVSTAAPAVTANDGSAGVTTSGSTPSKNQADSGDNTAQSAPGVMTAVVSAEANSSASALESPVPQGSSNSGSPVDKTASKQPSAGAPVPRRSVRIGLKRSRSPRDSGELDDPLSAELIEARLGEDRPDSVLSNHPNARCWRCKSPLVYRGDELVCPNGHADPLGET